MREEAVCTLDVLVVASSIFPQDEEIGAAKTVGECLPLLFFSLFVMNMLAFPVLPLNHIIS